MASLLKLTNNAIGRLNASITTSSTTIQLVPGQGAKFPALAAGEFFPCHLLAADGTYEIVKATARSGDNLTVVRAQEGTTAKAFAINDRCELRMTAGALQGELDRIASLTDGKQNALGFTPANISSPVFTGQVQVPEGSAATPGLAFANDGAPDTGFFHISDGAFGITCNGVLNASYQTGMQFGYGTHIQTANAANGTQRELFTGRQQNGTPRFRLGINNDERPVLWTYGLDGSFAGAICFSAGGIAADGIISAPVFSATSDERKKTNWSAIPDAVLDSLAEMVLAGFFDWKDGSGSSMGGSAQELRRIGLGQAVYEDAEGNLSVAYDGLNFAIVQAMLRRDKVHRAGIERRLAALESK